MTQPLLNKLFSRPACGALLLLSVVGCQNNSDSSSNAKADTAKPNFQIIRAGHPPFSTIVTSPGKIDVYDFDDKKVVMKKTAAPPNTLVTINPNGISLGVNVVSAQRMDRHHTYEVRLYQK